LIARTANRVAYCLRHSALTRFAESGCDAFTLAKIAGHSSITITQRYCHPQAEAIELAFQRTNRQKLVSNGGQKPNEATFRDASFLALNA